MIFLIWCTLNIEFVSVTFPTGRKSWGKNTDREGWGCAVILWEQSNPGGNRCRVEPRKEKFLCEVIKS